MSTVYLIVRRVLPASADAATIHATWTAASIPVLSLRKIGATVVLAAFNASPDGEDPAATARRIAALMETKFPAPFPVVAGIGQGGAQ